MSGVVHLRHGVIAGLGAALPCGLPSTAHAWYVGRDPWSAVRAAGSIIVGRRAPDTWKWMAAVPVHVGLSIGWGVVLSRLLPRRASTAWGGVAGVAIAGLDMGLLGRAFGEVAALPRAPQLADHIAYGCIVGLILSHLRGTRAG